MIGAHNTYVKEGICYTGLKERGHWEDLEVDWKLLLWYHLEKYCRGYGLDISGLKCGLFTEHCEHCNEL
jgi:hypothetical protein